MLLGVVGSVNTGGGGGRGPSELVAAGGLGKGLGFGLKPWRCSEGAARGWWKRAFPMLKLPTTTLPAIQKQAAPTEELTKAKTPRGPG